MAIKTNGLGGTDWTDEILYSVDLVGTFNAITAPADTGLNITRDSATGSAAVVSITQDNAGDYQPALSIQQDGAGMGLYVAVTKDVTNGQCARFFNSGKGANTIITQLAGGYSALGTNRFYRNLASADTTGPVVQITQDNAGDDQNALFIQNDGSRYGLFVDGTLTTNSFPTAFVRDSSEGNATNYVGMSYGTDADRQTMCVYRNLASGNTGASVCLINQTNAGDDQNALSIQQDGTGIGLSIDQNGAGVALNIDKEGAGVGVNIDQSSAGGNALEITNAGTGEGLQINQTGAASALNINQDGNHYGIYLHCDTTASAFYLYSNADTDAVQIHIGSGSTGNAGIRFYDISDDDDNWALELTTQSPTNPSAGAVWYDGTHIYCRIGGVSKQLDN